MTPLEEIERLSDVLAELDLIENPTDEQRERKATIYWLIEELEDEIYFED